MTDFHFRTVQKLEGKGNNGSQQVIKYEFFLFYLRFLSALWLTFISVNRSTSNDRENSITWATVQLKYFIEYSGEFCWFTIHYDAWKKFYEGLSEKMLIILQARLLDIQRMNKLSFTT